MKYLNKLVSEYDHEEMMEELKNYYLVKNNNPSFLRNIWEVDVRLEFSKLLESNLVDGFDEKFGEYLRGIISKRSSIEESLGIPMCGDFIRLMNGKLLRVTVCHCDRYDDSEDFQANDVDGSFHLSEDGYMTFSGACGSLYKTKKFKLSEEKEKGSFWFWDPKKGVGKDNGKNAKALFRVFNEIGEIR